MLLKILLLLSSSETPLLGSRYYYFEKQPLPRWNKISREGNK